MKHQPEDEMMNELKEIWKPVVGYEGSYEVSSIGRVRSLDRMLPNGRRRRGKIRKTPLGATRYPRVNLSRDGIQKGYFVHRLVLAAHVGPCPPGREGCHNDGTRTNNHVANLRWATRRDNQADRVLHGTHNRNAQNGRAKLSEENVHEIRTLLARGELSQREIGDLLNVTRSAICDINCGKRWAHLPTKETQ